MTMFSSKPKFDLAAFLAVPAPKGVARYRGGRGRGMQFQPSRAPQETPEPTDDEAAAAPVADETKSNHAVEADTAK